MRAKLLIKFRRGEQTLSEMVSISKDPCIIGRKNSDLVIKDKLCSKQHCLLYQDPEGCLRVKDLSSTNGTFVKGKKIEEWILNIGDELKVGHTFITVIEFEPATPSAEIVSPSSMASDAAENPVGMSRNSKEDGGMKNWFDIDKPPSVRFKPLAPEDETPAPQAEVPGKRKKRA